MPQVSLPIRVPQNDGPRPKPGEQLRTPSPSRAPDPRSGLVPTRQAAWRMCWRPHPSRWGPHPGLAEKRMQTHLLPQACHEKRFSGGCQPGPVFKGRGGPLLGQVTGREGLGAGPVGAAGTAPSQEPSHDQPARSAQIYRKAPHPHRAGCWRRPRPALMSCCPGPRPRGPLPWRCPAPGCGQDDHEPVRVTTEWPPVAHLGRGSTPRWLRTWTD